MAVTWLLLVEVALLLPGVADVVPAASFPVAVAVFRQVLCVA
ncbi:hypothetical protein [Streptomyces sp. NPDC058545]